MQTIWDLLPASIWPTQPFISPDETARTAQMLQVLQASASPPSLAAVGPDSRAGTRWTRTPSPVGPVSGGEDLSTTSAGAGPPSLTHLATADPGAQGGILGAIFGEPANSPLTMAPWMSLASVPQGRPFVSVPATRRQLGPENPLLPQRRYWLAQHGFDTGAAIPADYGQAAQPEPVDYNSFAAGAGMGLAEAPSAGPDVLGHMADSADGGKEANNTPAFSGGPVVPMSGVPVLKALGPEAASRKRLIPPDPPVPRITNRHQAYRLAQHEIDTGPPISAEYEAGSPLLNPNMWPEAI